MSNSKCLVSEDTNADFGHENLDYGKVMVKARSGPEERLRRKPTLCGMCDMDKLVIQERIST